MSVISGVTASLISMKTYLTAIDRNAKIGGSGKSALRALASKIIEECAKVQKLPEFSSLTTHDIYQINGLKLAVQTHFTVLKADNVFGGIFTKGKTVASIESALTYVRDTSEVIERALSTSSPKSMSGVDEEGRSGSVKIEEDLFRDSDSVECLPGDEGDRKTPPPASFVPIHPGRGRSDSEDSNGSPVFRFR